MRHLGRMSEGFKWSVIVLLCLVGYWNYRGMISFTLAMFNSPIEDMAHGWAVPFFSAYVIWKQRKQWSALSGNSSWAGVFFVAAFLFSAFFGSRGGQSRIEQFSLIGLIWSVPFALWGAGVGKLMVFPSAFLLFTIPISSFLDFFTIHLRIFSTSVATFLLNGMGLAVEKSGTALFSHVPGSEFNVDVADPCSGIRSLFAMMALAAAYAYFMQKQPRKKWILFACSIPVAVVGNMIRIMSICVVAAWFGQQAATGYYHDYSGYAVFLVEVLLIIGMNEWLTRIGSAPRKTEEDSQEDAISQKASCTEESVSVKKSVPEKDVVITALVLLLGLSVFSMNLWHPTAVLEKSDFVSRNLPEKIGEFAGDRPWFCHNEQCLAMNTEQQLVGKPKDAEGRWKCPDCGKTLFSISLGEKSDLPQDTEIVKKTYKAPDGLVYAISVVIGGQQRNSIHRAELCLPAQGFVMQDAKKIHLQISGKTINARCIRAMRSGGTPFNLVYWFESNTRSCCSHTERILLDVWDRSIHNRINRWIMIAVNISSPLDTPEAIERFESFLSDFYSCAVLKESGGKQ